MSNAVYPVLPGRKWPLGKRPNFATMIQRGVAGGEVRATNMLDPIWDFTLAYDILRDASAIVQNVAPASPNDELRKLEGFFLAHRGAFESFLFDDPSDNDVTAQQFGVGDAVTTAFQLVRSMGVGQTFAEAVANLNGAPQIFRNDWQGNQLLFATPRTNLLVRSQQIDDAAWTKSNILSLTPDAAVAPDGTTTADVLVENAVATVGHSILQQQNVVAGSLIPASGYVKRVVGARHVRLDVTGSSAVNGFRAYFDLTSGTLNSTQAFGTGLVSSASIEVLPNSWYRMNVAGTIDPAETAARYTPFFMQAVNGTAIYTGDGVSSLAFWGCQMGASGAYIPTVAAAATVTDYALDTKGLVTFASAPLVGAILTWTGAYYYRARFGQDMSEFEQFMNDLWQLGKVQLRASLGTKI